MKNFWRKFLPKNDQSKANRMRSVVKHEIRCPDCGVLEGQLHEPFCTKELCPFCGDQLISCDCIKEVLQLNEEECRVVDEYVNDFEEPLKTIVKNWDNELSKKGRVPFIYFPWVCAKCGKVNPKSFHVPAKEWNRYIPINMRKSILCEDCFGYIKDVVDKNLT